MSYGVGHRHGSDVALLWLWRRLVAVAPIRPLASICSGCGPKKTKRPKKKKKKATCGTILTENQMEIGRSTPVQPRL